MRVGLAALGGGRVALNSGPEARRRRRGGRRERQMVQQTHPYNTPVASD